MGEQKVNRLGTSYHLFLGVEKQVLKSTLYVLSVLNTKQNVVKFNFFLIMKFNLNFLVFYEVYSKPEVL